MKKEQSKLCKNLISVLIIIAIFAILVLLTTSLAKAHPSKTMPKSPIHRIQPRHYPTYNYHFGFPRPYYNYTPPRAIPYWYYHPYPRHRFILSYGTRYARGYIILR